MNLFTHRVGPRGSRRSEAVAMWLAACLQVMPLLRAQLGLWGEGAVRGAVILLRWATGALGLAGAFHSVSGASATISGLTQYQNNRPVGKTLTSVVTQVGQTFNYRITVLNPGSDHAEDYFNCLPIPAGLTLNTNVGGTGFITGAPTQAGTYAVRLVAGNTKHPTPVFLDVSILVNPRPEPPTIVVQPQSRSVLAGRSVVFAVTASGTSPLGYQWLFNGATIPGGTNATLTLTDLTQAQAGRYHVVVTNSLGAAVSQTAELTVQERFSLAPRLDQVGFTNGVFAFRITGPPGLRYRVSSTGNWINWQPVATNDVVDGLWLFTAPVAPVSGNGFRAFRVAVDP